MASRTASGIRSEHLFYRGEFLVVVEGGEDVPFWSEVFPKVVGLLRAHVKAVGGRTQLEKYISELGSDGGRTIVAIDSDFDVIFGRCWDHIRVVATGCHSIENVMCCPCRVAMHLAGLGLYSEVPTETVAAWFKEYDVVVAWLLAAEVILIERGGHMPEGGIGRVARFVDSGSSARVSFERVKARLEECGLAESEVAVSLPRFTAYPPRFHYRGHFLFEAASHFVRKEAARARKKPISISADAFYAAMAIRSQVCEECAPRVYDLRRKAFAAAAALVQPT